MNTATERVPQDDTVDGARRCDVFYRSSRCSRRAELVVALKSCCSDKQVHLCEECYRFVVRTGSNSECFQCGKSDMRRSISEPVRLRSL